MTSRPCAARRPWPRRRLSRSGRGARPIRSRGRSELHVRPIGRSPPVCPRCPLPDPPRQGIPPLAPCARVGCKPRSPVHVSRQESVAQAPDRTATTNQPDSRPIVAARNVRSLATLYPPQFGFSPRTCSDLPPRPQPGAPTVHGRGGFATASSIRARRGRPAPPANYLRLGLDKDAVRAIVPLVISANPLLVALEREGLSPDGASPSGSPGSSPIRPPISPPLTWSPRRSAALGIGRATIFRTPTSSPALVPWSG